jgi:hypothetical protein
MQYPSSRAHSMTSFRGRMLLAQQESAAAEAAQRQVIQDPLAEATSRLQGYVDRGFEYITVQAALRALEIPEDEHLAFAHRLPELMRRHGWQPTRISNGAGARVRGYVRPAEFESRRCAPRCG